MSEYLLGRPNIRTCSFASTPMESIDDTQSHGRANLSETCVHMPEPAGAQPTSRFNAI